jgi:glycosyltransferase involved in cell wall biosynthesis
MKKKMVFVTTRFPWPLTNGFATKNFWLIRGLSLEYDIDLHVIQFASVVDGDLLQIASYCNSINVYQPSYWDILFGLAKSVIFDLPLQVGLFNSARARRKIGENLKSSEIAICSVIRAAQFLKKYQGPIIYDLADSLGQIYLRDSRKFKGLRRIVYQEEGRRMSKYEQSIVRSGAQVVFFNPVEAQFYGLSNVSHVPHGVNPSLFELVESDAQCSDGVVIFGKMNYEPNVNAVHWFCENVLGLLPNSIVLYVIGVSPSAGLLKLALKNPRVKVLGFIENPYPLIRGSIASICPIQIGGGIQNKVIESLAIGALTIASPLAAVTMNQVEDSGMIICDTPISWAQNIIEIIENPKAYNINRQVGSAYVRNHFSWDSYVAAIRNRITLAWSVN